MNDSQDLDFDRLLELVAQSFQTTPEQIKTEIGERMRRRANRAHRANERYAEALRRVTPEQLKTIEALRALGAKPWDKLRQSRETGRVCIFLSRQAFDSAKGRMGTKTYAVYPDGTRSETFERSISVRANF